MVVTRPSDGSVTITAPAFDPNTDGSKSVQELIVEQNWRDAAEAKLDKRFPDSINLESARVTDS